MLKDMGGIRFRDMWDFNSAMLMKIAWRLQDEQTSIWSRVMKGFYFSKGEFLDANKGARRSWVWASIRIGRDVLQTNGVQQVVSRYKIRVLPHAWIPRIHVHSLWQDERDADQESVRVEKLIMPSEIRRELSRIQRNKGWPLSP